MADFEYNMGIAGDSGGSQGERDTLDDASKAERK